MAYFIERKKLVNFEAQQKAEKNDIGMKSWLHGPRYH
jgi:hypothetical protein